MTQNSSTDTSKKLKTLFIRVVEEEKITIRTLFHRIGKGQFVPLSVPFITSPRLADGEETSGNSRKQHNNAF